MKRRLISVFVLLVALAQVAGCGREKSSGKPAASTLDAILRARKIKVGTNPGYKPFEMIDKDGKVVGFDIDVARFMADKLGVELEVIVTDWDPAISNLNAGKFDVIISGMTRTLERALACNFTDPYFKTGQALIVNKKKYPPGTIKSHKFFNRRGAVISTKLGTTGEIAARKEFPLAEIKTFEDESEAALEVDTGRADIMVYDQPFCAFHAGEVPEKVYAVLEPFTSEYLAFALRKGDPDFLSWLNLAIFELHQSGVYDSLFNKWFVEMPWLEKVK